MIVPLNVQETPMIIKNRALRGEVPNAKQQQQQQQRVVPDPLAFQQDNNVRVVAGGRRRSSIGMRGKRMSSSTNGLSRKNF
jgi:hypothetical protein